MHDGLFLSALSVYAVNRLVVRPHFAGFLSTHLPWSWSFLHGHLDDLLLIPAALPVVLHELAPQAASLEEAYMELTEDSVEFHGGTTSVTSIGERL